MARGAARAVMAKQPEGRDNACWAPPVMAMCHFYGIAELPSSSKSDRAWPVGAGGGAITVDSILGLRAGDYGEEACEVMEDITGWWYAESAWGNDEACIEGSGWGGPTAVDDYGTHAVADGWWAALKQTIEGGNIVLVLVERLEGSRDKGHTHYLLVLGFEEQVRRRGGNVRKLWLKDPMEGDQLLEAELWADREYELTTKQADTGKPMDRYSILEATHLAAAVVAAAGANAAPVPPAAAADAASSTASGT